MAPSFRADEQGAQGVERLLGASRRSKRRQTLELPDSHAKASQRSTGWKRGGNEGRDELMESINGGVDTGR